MSKLSVAERIDHLCELLKGKAVATRLTGQASEFTALVDLLTDACEGRCVLTVPRPARSFAADDSVLHECHRYHFSYDFRNPPSATH